MAHTYDLEDEAERFSLKPIRTTKERNVSKRHCSWRSYWELSTWGLKQAFCSCSPHLWKPIKKLISLRSQQNFSNILNTETIVHIILEVSENSTFFWPQVLLVVLIAMKSLLSSNQWVSISSNNLKMNPTIVSKCRDTQLAWGLQISDKDSSYTRYYWKT